MFWTDPHTVLGELDLVVLQIFLHTALYREGVNSGIVGVEYCPGKYAVWAIQEVALIEAAGSKGKEPVPQVVLGESEIVRESRKDSGSHGKRWE